MNKGTSGSAFPVPETFDRNTQWFTAAERGMTLRDYFAAKAMQSMKMYSEENGRQGFGYESVESIAKRAYEMADAMLAERAK